MKKYVLFIIFLLIIPLIYEKNVHAQKNHIYAYVMVKDFFENNPLENISFSVTLYSRISKTSFEAKTNSSGTAVIDISQSFKLGYRIPVIVQKIKIYNNTYVPIRVNNLLIEENNIQGIYNPNTNVSEVSLKSPCRIMRVRGNYVIEIVISLVKGVEVNVTDYNPFTDSKEELIITPALKVYGKSTKYVSQYIFPMGYPVLIRKTSGVWENRFTVSKPNTTIMVTKILTESQALTEIEKIEDDISWLSELGYPVKNEVEQIKILKYLFAKAIYFLDNKEYSSFNSIMNTFNFFKDKLRIGIDNLKKGLMLAFLSLILLIFGFTSVISLIFFENLKYKDIIKIIFFMALFLLIILFDPSSRISIAYIMMLMGVNIFELDYLTIIASSIIFGALAYFVYFAISFYAKPSSKSAITIAIRYIKSKKLRTILTILTLSLLSASAVLTVGVSIESKLQEDTIDWNHGFEGGVIVFNIPPPNISDILWILNTLNLSDYSVIRTENLDYECSGILYQQNVIYNVRIVGINATFFKKYMNYTSYLVGKPISNNSYIINIPSTYSSLIKTGETTEIWLMKVSEQTGDVVPYKKIIDNAYAGGIYDENRLLRLFNLSGEFLLPIIYPTYIFVSEDVLPPNEYPISAIIFATHITPQKIDFLKKIARFLGVTIYLSNGVRIYKPTMITLKGLSSFLITIIFSSLLIMITMYGTIEYEKNDLKTVAILGGSPRNIAHQILLEGLIMGFTATFIGCFSSPLLIYLFKNIPQLASSTRLQEFYVTIDSIYVSLFVGLFSSVIGSYIPAIKMKEASLFNREERRVLSQEDLRIVKDEAIYQLPLRTSIFELNTLYSFLKEEIVSPKELLREKIGEDGLFRIYLSVTTPDGFPITMCLRTVKRRDDILLELAIPKEHRYYMRLSQTIRKIEEKILRYSEWKEKRIRYMLVRRERPKAAKPFNILLEEALQLLEKYNQLKEKMERLSKIRHTVSPKTYKIYYERYTKDLSKIMTNIRTYSLKLEPYYKEMKDKVRELSTKIEEIDVAYKLGEISEARYRAEITPLRKQLEELNNTITKIENIKKVLSIR